MKNIKQIRESFDLITEKEEKEDRKLSALVRAGLYDAKKLPALKKALDKSADKMTAQEKRMLLNLLDSLISQVTSDEQVYRKVRQNVHSMNEAKEDYLSKFDPRFKSGYPSDKDIPTVLVLKRKAIRVYPDNQKVALYYSQSLDKYVTIPFSDIQTGLNEAVQTDKDNEDKKRPKFKLKPNTSSAFKQAKEKTKEDKFDSIGARYRDLRGKGINLGGTAGTIWHDIAKGKLTPSAPSEPKASTTPEPSPAATKPVTPVKSDKPKRTYRSRRVTAGPARVKSQAATRRSAKAAIKRNPNAAAGFTPRAVQTGKLQDMKESFDQKLQMIREDDIDSYEFRMMGGLGQQFTPYGGGRFGGGGSKSSANSSKLSTKKQTGVANKTQNLQAPVGGARGTIHSAIKDRIYKKTLYQRFASDRIRTNRYRSNAVRARDNAAAPPSAGRSEYPAIAAKNTVVTSGPNIKVPKAQAAKPEVKKIEPPRQDKPPVGSTSRSVYPQQQITSKDPVVKSGPNIKVPKAQAAKPQAAKPQAATPQTTKIKPREDKPPVGSTGQSPYPKQQITSKDPTKIQRPQGQNAAAQKAADKNAKRINDRNEKALRNRETKQGKRPQSKFGAALAAAAAGGAALLGAGGAGGENPAGVFHKFVKKADVGNAWALQKKDLPDTQQRRMQQANRRALETTNESVLSTIKDMVNNDIQEQTLVINEQEININNTVAKKIVLVYESVNKDNKKKMENMLNESAASFNKVLTFALRQ